MLDGPINGASFLAWTKQFLVPALRPGDIVVADRLGSHRNAAAREAIEACGAQLNLLPAYSQDLNPIEQVFAKIKALLRQAAPRSRETLWRTIGEKLSSFSPTECTNYLRNCGYGHPVRPRASSGQVRFEHCPGLIAQPVRSAHARLLFQRTANQNITSSSTR